MDCINNGLSLYWQLKKEKHGSDTMSWLATIWLAIALGMDAFAVSIAVMSSGKGDSPRATFRLSFHFGLFQFLMPVLGWLLGTTVAEYIQAADHWIAFILLAVIGGRMIYGALNSSTESFNANDPTKGWSLVLLSIGTSIDALAVGLSLAFLNVDVWLPSVIIGIVAAGMTLLGIRLGRVLSIRFGKRMELIGGVVLVSIGAKILVEHLGLLGM